MLLLLISLRLSARGLGVDTAPTPPRTLVLPCPGVRGT